MDAAGRFAHRLTETAMDLGRLFSLEGRIAVVTGGSAGIGRSITEGFIASGARVYISARKMEQCEATARELGPNCFALPHDLSTVEGCRALVEDFQARETRLDILVNNAGKAWGADFESFPEHGWDRVMDLNVKTPFFLSQLFYPQLSAAALVDQPSKIINIGSIDGLRLNSWETYSYQASKAALLQLTRRLAARLVRDRIHVSAIAPGAFASSMNKAARDRTQNVSSVIPAGRIGAAEDIAAAAIYLASRAGDYVVGETITVDGGLVHASLGASIDG